MSLEADVPTTVEQAWDDLKGLGRSLKKQGQTWSALLASGMDGRQVISMLATLNSYTTRITTLVATPGLSTYVNDLKNGVYDFDTESAAVLSELSNTISVIDSGAPQDGNGWRQLVKFTPAIEWRTFTVGQAAPLKTAVDSLVAAL